MTRWKRRLLRKALSGLLTSPDWAAASHDRRCTLLLNAVETFMDDAGALIALRDELIRRRFDGRNIADLAAAFDLHPRQIRRVVHPRRRRK